MPAPRSLAASLLILVTLAALAGPAAAHDDDDPFGRGRVDVAVGLLAGNFSTGPLSGPGVGMHLDVGWNHGPIYLYGEYDLLSVGEQTYMAADKPIRGLLQRVSANARYSFFDAHGQDFPLGGELWLEGGLGRQRIDWDEGGRLSRNDLSLGFGAQLNVVAGRHQARPQVFGVYYALKLTVAKDPGPRGMPGCAGPCDEPTPPSPWDLGVFFNMGVSWGR
jgi:hypothetical protein